MKSVHNKTRYSDEELLEFRALIEKKITEGNEQLEFYLAQLNAQGTDSDAKIRGLDDGIGTRENERISTLASRQKKHLQHLENALLRIENKVYGICRVSGILISKERLKAVPHATLSISAKQNRVRR
ncbi:MAG: TraR/DksA family transcriptional regulator [Bacteroidia bacterium]|nr:TraR/DksA family transcriptional regulator [Bacteroidia bacterium]